jgi:hypothetical protein
MVGFGPLSDVPVSSLPFIHNITVIGTANVQGQLLNPLADLVSDPNKRLVFAVELTFIPIVG